MAREIVGREAEKGILKKMLESQEAELVVILGRRRIGKTFLVNNLFEKEIVFTYEGTHNDKLNGQLQNFMLALGKAVNSPAPLAVPVNWSLAFNYLSSFLGTKLSAMRPIVIFFDEFPWIHTPRSGFLSAFTHWWNSWASKEPHLKVILCGSAAGWMTRNVIYNKGGLHNRVTRQVWLDEFSLRETAAFLSSRGVVLEHLQIVQLYMAIGGVPHYLKKVEPGESWGQFIDRQFFEKNAELRVEFNVLYQSLFDNADKHELIVKLLAAKRVGLSRTELIKMAGLTTGGTTSKLFDELEASGFISYYVPYGKTSSKGLYKLTDAYSLFYLKFVNRSRVSGKDSWHKIENSASYISWSGFAFEAVCYKHIQQIKQALSIAGVQVEVDGWRSVSQIEAGELEKRGVQIDLLLDRADKCINVCEIKYCADEFVIDKAYGAELDRKIRLFKEETKTKKTIFLTMITTLGTKKNIHYTGRVMKEVTLEDLFAN